MRQFKRVTGVVMRDAWRGMAMLLGEWVLFSVALWIAQAMHWVSWLTYTTGVSVIFFALMFAGFVNLAVMQERMWVGNVWRLTSTPGWQLYLSGLLTSLLVYVVSFVIGTAGLAVWSTLIGENTYGFVQPNLAFVALIVLFTVVFPLLGWTFISLIHMVSNIAGDYLPILKQQTVRFLTILVLVFIGSNLVGRTVGLLAQVMIPGRVGDFEVNSLSSAITVVSRYSPQFWSTIAVFGVVVLILGILNAYLISRWLETNQTQYVG